MATDRNVMPVCVCAMNVSVKAPAITSTILTTGMMN